MIHLCYLNYLLNDPPPPAVQKGVYIGEPTIYPEDIAKFPSEGIPFTSSLVPITPLGVPNIYALYGLTSTVHGLPYQAHQIP